MAIFKNEIDISDLVEAKVNVTFGDNQFLLQIFRQPYNFDGNTNWGGILTNLGRVFRANS